MRFCLLAFLATCLFSQTDIADAKDKPWIEVRSSHFRVLTGCSSADARHAAGEMERMRYVFATRLPSARLESGAPLTLFVTCNDETRKVLMPQLSEGIAGVFFPGREKQFGLIRMDGWAGHEQQVVFHEYTHSILHMNSHWMPLWMDEGWAEFYGYTPL